MAGLAAGVMDRSPALSKSKKPSSRENTAATRQPTGNHPVLQLQAAVGNRAVLQMMRSGALGNSVSGNGVVRNMPAAVQAKMESAFNTDFSGVTIHEGTRASSIGAQAYTQGSDIHFAPGRFNPGTASGQRLLGHELAHVVQQREGRVSAPQGKGLPIVASPALEAEADRSGERAARGLPVQGRLPVQLKQDGGHMREKSSCSCNPGIGAALRQDSRTPIQGNWFTDLFSRKKKEEQEDQPRKEEGQQDVLKPSREQQQQKPPENSEQRKEGPEGSQKNEEESQPVIGKPENVVMGGGHQPSSDDIKLKADEIEDPEKALEGYLDYSAENVKQMGRHEFKIHRYRDYLEGDLDFVLPAVAQFRALNERKAKLQQETAGSSGKSGGDKEKSAGRETDKQKAEEFRKIDKDLETIRDSLCESREVEDEKGEKIKVRGEEPEQSERNARDRYDLARRAEAVVDAENPVVGYAYDKIKEYRDEIKNFKKTAKKAKSDIEHRGMNNKIATLVKSYKKDAARLAKQSSLSESHVAVKRKQLKFAKATVKGVLGRGLTFWQYMKSKLFYGILSAGLSAVTLGAVEIDTQKSKGGYDKKSKVVFSYWNNWKKDYNEFKAIAKAKPFGSLTTAHLFLKGVGELFIKPLRNLFTGVATVAGLLSLIPPLAPVCGSIAAVCTTAAVILAMAKGALDVLLTTWNLLTLAMNNNPRNTDLLRAQATSTAVNVLVDSAQVGSGVAGAAVGNALGGNYSNAFDVMRSGNLSLGGSGDGGLLSTALRSGTKQVTTQGTKMAGSVASGLSQVESMGPGAKANFKFSQESQQEREPGHLRYHAPQESGDNPGWMNEEIRKDRQMRDEAQRGLARKAGIQLAGLLNDTNRAAGKSSKAEADANLVDSKTRSEAGKKGNPSDIQDADKENTKGMKESVRSGSGSLKELADNLKDGIKLAQELGKAS